VSARVQMSAEWFCPMVSVVMLSTSLPFPLSVSNKGFSKLPVPLRIEPTSRLSGFGQTIRGSSF
jgi:hypothetical protein